MSACYDRNNCASTHFVITEVALKKALKIVVVACVLLPAHKFSSS